MSFASVKQPLNFPPSTRRAVPPRLAPAGKYKNFLDCFAKTFAQDGIFAFYKGFWPNFGRLGSWNVAMFVVLEQLKSLAYEYSDAA